MLFFGHLGITAGAAYATNKKYGYDIDLRKAALLGLAPDLIDKPLGLLYPNVFENHTRLVAHHALFCLILLAVFWAFRRRIKHPFVYWGAYFGHIVLDRVWRHGKGLENFLWPLLGPPGHLEHNFARRWFDALFDPYNAFGEIFGILILAYLLRARHAR